MLVRMENNRMAVLGDSLSDAVDWLRTTPRVWSTSSSEGHHNEMSWDMCLGWQGALRMAKDGWQEGATKLATNLAVIPPNDIEPEWTYDVAGGVPDIGRFVAGEPEHMRDHGHPLGRKPTVHLVINVICAGIVGATEFINYGTAMLSMIDQLENNGRSVEVDVVTVNSFTGRGRGIFGWKVKRAGDHVNLADIAFSIGHPAAYRRFGFAMWERTPASWHSYGYGTCDKLTIADAALIDAEDAFLLDGIGTSYGRCRTLEGALQLAAEQINKAAGETLVEVEN